MTTFVLLFFFQDVHFLDSFLFFKIKFCGSISCKQDKETILLERKMRGITTLKNESSLCRKNFVILMLSSMRTMEVACRERSSPLSWVLLKLSCTSGYNNQLQTHTQFHISKSLRRNRVFGENASEGVDLGSTESFRFITVGTLEILNIVLLHI